VKERIWRDANMAEGVGDVGIGAELGGRVAGLEIRSNSPGAASVHLNMSKSSVATDSASTTFRSLIMRSSSASESRAMSFS
jgi:hypothetical protein